MIHPHPILAAVLVILGAFGMFSSGMSLSLALLGRRTYSAVAIDLVLALAILAVGWCFR